MALSYEQLMRAAEKKERSMAEKKWGRVAAPDMAKEKQRLFQVAEKKDAARSTSRPWTTEERIKDAETDVANWEKRVGEIKERTRTPVVGSTSYGWGSDPALSKPAPAVGSTSYGAGSATQVTKGEDPALVAKSFLRDSQKRLARLQQTKEWEDIHATGIEGVQDQIERLADDEGTLKQERDQVRKEINDLTADFEAKGGAWKQSEAAVKEYSLTRAALQGREAELTAQLDAKGKDLAQSRRNLTILQREKKGEEWEQYRQASDYEEVLREAPKSKLYVSENSELGKKTLELYNYLGERGLLDGTGILREAMGARFYEGKYSELSKKELELYNYLVQRDIRDGTVLSLEYMSWLGETLAQRKGAEKAKEIRGIDNSLVRGAATVGYAAGSGFDRFARGIERGMFGWVMPEESATSSMQYGSQYIREDLEDVGPEILGSSLGQIGYDVVSNTANMLPSIAVGAINPALGAASVGLSAGGNAYDEAIRDGYSPDQARAYAFLCGASEAGLQYFLGGISKLGSNVIGNSAIGKQVAASIQNIRSATMRVAAELGTKMLSEASEEYLQEILGPVFRNLALGEDNEFHLVTEEAAYAALLAIITTGVVEGPSTVDSAIAQRYNNYTDIRGGKIDGTQSRTQLDGTAGTGIRAFVPDVDRLQQGAGGFGQEDLSTTGELRLTEDRLEYSHLLDEARDSDKVHGWAVTPKTADELVDCRIFLSEDGGVGFAVAPDGDIEAVFRNQRRHPRKGAMKIALLQAIAEGGTKLDCYGRELVNVYANSGFIPVARVAFDPEFANPGWTPDKGMPDIYVMMATDTDPDVVIQKQGSYPYWSDAELAALPLMEYDEAMAYRDNLLAQRGISGSMDGSFDSSAIKGIEQSAERSNPEVGDDVMLEAIRFFQEQAMMGSLHSMDAETEARLTQAAKEMYGADQTQKTAAQTDGGGRFSLKGYEGVDLSKDGSVYTYDFLTSLPDMSVTTLPDVTAVRDANGQVDTRTVVDLGMKNARAVGAERDGKVFVRNRYTGKQLLVTSESIRHGLNGNIKRLLTNARLGAVIGDVVQNAMPINALLNQAEGVTGTYAMAGYATDNAGREFVAIITVEQYDGNVSGIEVYDVAHAVSGRQKRGERVDTKSQGFYPSTNASTVSVADFLKIVKETHQSILSEDVLSCFGEDRNPGGYYTDKAKFSLKTGEDALTQMALEMGAEGRKRGQEGNAKAIQRAAHSFGEQGSKMLQELYWSDAQDPEKYFGGFAVYYHAGLTGQDIMSVREDYDDVIKPIQAWAAYQAGQVDAAESLAAEIKAAGYAPVAGTDAGLVGDEYVASHLDSKTYRQLNSVLKLLGVRGRFVDGSLVLNGKANAQIKGSEVLIAKDHQHPIRFVLGHELTHRIQRLSPEAYRTFRDFVAQDLVVRNEIEYKRRTYGEKGVELDYEGALDEAVADYAGELLEDGRLMDEFIERHRTDKTLLEKLHDGIRYLVNKLTGKEKQLAQTAEGKLAAALDAAAEQAKALTKESGGQNTGLQTDEAGRYLLNTDFAKEVDQWLEETSPEDRLVSHGYFQVGTTSDALKSIGVRDGNIFWRKQKIGYIMTTHSEMDADTIKMVPDLIENPVVVMKSLTREDSIVLLGNVTGVNGDRVMASLELTPRKGGGMEAEFALLTSAYSRTKGNIQNLLKNSEILYLDPDKKRTDTWLMQLRVQFPSGQPVYGSIGSISYDREKVNIQGVKNLFDTK